MSRLTHWNAYWLLTLQCGEREKKVNTIRSIQFEVICRASIINIIHSQSHQSMFGLLNSWLFASRYMCTCMHIYIPFASVHKVHETKSKFSVTELMNVRRRNGKEKQSKKNICLYNRRAVLTRRHILAVCNECRSKMKSTSQRCIHSKWKNT